MPTPIHELARIRDRIQNAKTIAEAQEQALILWHRVRATEEGHRCRGCMLPQTEAFSFYEAPDDAGEREPRPGRFQIGPGPLPESQRPENPPDRRF